MTAPRRRPRPRRPNNMRPIEVWRIILWSGLTNLVLLSIFLGTQRFDVIDYLARHVEIPAYDDIVVIIPADGTSTVSSVMSKRDLATAASISGVPKNDFLTSTTVVAKSELEAGKSDAGEVVSTEVVMASTAELALSAGASVDDSEILSAKPILQRNPQSGKLEIGNFKSLTVVGSAGECMNFGRSLLSDAKSSDDKLDVVVAADEITIARICAANGSVIITCRGGQVAVSPRKSRPDDRCTQSG